MLLEKFLQICLAVTLVTSAVGALNEVEDEDVRHVFANQPFMVTIHKWDNFGLLESFRLTVEPSDTIADLKHMIALHQNSRLPANEQELYLMSNGQEKLLANDEDTLSLYNSESSVDIKVKSISQTSTPSSQGQASSSTKGTYFGVDPDDEEAVNQKIREMSEQKLKDLFGEDFDLEPMDFKDDFERAHHNIGNGIKKAVNWLFNLVSDKKNQAQKANEKKN